MANKGQIIIESQRSDEGETCSTIYHIDDIIEKRAKPKYPIETHCK